MGLLWADSLALDYGEKDIYMTNLASESYDNLVYPSKPFPYTSINMLAAQARIWGLEPVPIRGAKVLELGSSFGGNIISQALYFPESQFVGIDLSETQIKEGQKIIATMGLTNIRLEEANIMDIDKSFGSFDYIIVHGIWSWVPDVVKEKILTICSQNLTEQGIAYVSYNTYPGWKRLDQIRDMMLFASEGQENLLKATQEGKAFIKGVAEAIQVDKDASHKRSSLLQDIDIILQKSDYYVAHEHLATFNDPVYVSDFISRAEAAGCAYIGDSNFQLSFTSWLDQEIKDLIESWDDQDQARREQIIDYMKNTQFRRALLTSQANGKHVRRDEQTTREILRDLCYMKTDQDKLFLTGQDPLLSTIEELAEGNGYFTLDDISDSMARNYPSVAFDEERADKVLFHLLVINRLYVYMEDCQSQPFRDNETIVPKRYIAYVETLLGGAHQYIWGSNQDNNINNLYNEDILFIMKACAHPLTREALVQSFKSYKKDQGLETDDQSYYTYIDKILAILGQWGYLASCK